MTRSALPAVNRRQALQFGGVVAALSLFGLTACSTREVVADDAGAAGGASTEITVTDQFGNTLVFAKAVERIATTIIPSPSMIAAADQGLASIVSVNSVAQMQAKNGIFGTMFPELLALPVSSGADFVPNVESILQQNPDVVIQWGDQGDGIIDPLRAAGLPVVLLKYGTQEDLEEWITLFGTLLGQEKRATEILATMHADRAAVEAAVKKALGAGAAPRVLELYSLAETKVSAKDSYMDFWITLAGGTNVAAAAGSGTSLAVTKEQILLWNPEVIFLGNFSPATPADIYADADFASLDAVHNKRVYKVPLGGFPWDPPCDESNLMWLWATELVHPGTTGAGLRDRIAATFEYLYAYSPSAEQIDGILHSDLNASSSGYDVFAA